MDILKTDTRKLYFAYLISALGSTIITTIYSTVDMICVGHYQGPVGSAAIACVNPFWTLMFAPGVLLAMGGSVMFSNRRGSGDERSALEYFTVASAVCAVLSVLITLAMIVFPEELLTAFGAEGEVLAASLRYIRPIAFISPTFTMCVVISTFVRNDGEVVLPTVATVIGGVINIFGDIFFVFDFGLGLGMFGAGLATASGQVVAFLIVCTYFLRRKCKLRFTKIHDFLEKLGKICTVGLSAFITDASFGVVTILFNNMIMKSLSADHLAVYGTVSSALVMLQCIYVTLGSALQPIVSENFGAGKRERVRSVFRTALFCSAVLGVIFTLLTQLFPLGILKIYMDVTETVALIGPAILRKYMLGIGVAGVSIVISYYLQSVLRRSSSTAVSLLRGLILPCVFAVAFTALFGIESIWYAVAVAEICTTIVAAALVLRRRR